MDDLDVGGGSVQKRTGAKDKEWTMYACVCMYVYMFVCVYVCVKMCIYVYICIYICIVTCDVRYVKQATSQIALKVLIYE